MSLAFLNLTGANKVIVFGIKIGLSFDVLPVTHIATINKLKAS